MVYLCVSGFCWFVCFSFVWPRRGGALLGGDGGYSVDTGRLLIDTVDEHRSLIDREYCAEMELECVFVFVVCLWVDYEE